VVACQTEVVYGPVQELERSLDMMLDHSNRSGKEHEDVQGLFRPFQKAQCLWQHVKSNDMHASVQELERGLDTMLDAYGNNAGQEHEDVQGPSAPHPAASKKKPQRPSKKPRGASSSQGTDLVLM